MRVSKEAQQVSIAQAHVGIGIQELQEKHDLTDIEMLQAVSRFVDLKLKYMLRYERHGDYETPAGVDKEE